MEQEEQNYIQYNAYQISVIMDFLGLKFGDYCHAHKFVDANPLDPSAVGFLKEISIRKNGVFYRLEGEGVPNRWWKHCRKITQEEGKEILGD